MATVTMPMEMYELLSACMKMKSQRDKDIQEQKKENEQLEEENEILKQFALDVHNFAFSTNMDDLDIVSAMDLGSVVEELNKDEDKMYKEIQELKKENDKFKNLKLDPEKDFGLSLCLDETIIWWINKCRLLRDESIQLEKENEELKDKVDTLEQQTEGFRVEYPKLKKENEEVKEGIQNIIDVKDEEIKFLNDKLVVVKKENEELKQHKQHLDIIFQELWSYDGEYDGKVDESVKRIKDLLAAS